MHKQPLLQPKRLAGLGPLEQSIIREHVEVFQKNGFDFVERVTMPGGKQEWRPLRPRQDVSSQRQQQQQQEEEGVCHLPEQQQEEGDGDEGKRQQLLGVRSKQGVEGQGQEQQQQHLEELGGHDQQEQQGDEEHRQQQQLKKRKRQWDEVEGAESDEQQQGKQQRNRVGRQWQQHNQEQPGIAEPGLVSMEQDADFGSGAVSAAAGGWEGDAAACDGEGVGEVLLSSVPHSRGAEFGEAEVLEMVEALAAGEGPPGDVRPKR